MSSEESLFSTDNQRDDVGSQRAISRQKSSESLFDVAYLVGDELSCAGGLRDLSCLVFDTACSLNDRLDFDAFLLLEKLSVWDWLGRRVNIIHGFRVIGSRWSTPIASKSVRIVVVFVRRYLVFGS